MATYDRAAQYDRVGSADDELQQPQQRFAHDQQQIPSTIPSSSSSFLFPQPNLHLPDFSNATNAIRARASSIVSAVSSSSSHHSNRPPSPPVLLTIRTGSVSSSDSPTSPVLPNYSDTLSFQRNKRYGSASSGGSHSSSSSSSSKSQRALSHLSTHVRVLRLGWCLALLVGEVGSYWGMIQRCHWPENALWDISEDTLNQRYRIAIIADPQLTDWYSYKQTGVLLKLVETYTDLYMKRSFRHLHSTLKPDAVLFLGDLNDGGRESPGSVFAKNSNRFFEHIFGTKSSAWNQKPIVRDDDSVRDQDQDKHDDNNGIAGRYRQQIDIPLDAVEREAIRKSGRSLRLYMAGNHDVGFGDTLIRPYMRRFKEVFGSINYEVQVGNHSLVVLDTLALSSGVQNIREESQQFLTQLEQESQVLPRILFTHVPLFRLDTTPCGKARETKQLILNRGGYQYRNMVNATLSREILRGIQPDMVFSGDDHDWCEIAHSLDGKLTPEVTVPTFSFAQGIQQPAFVMLSLYNPDLKEKNDVQMIATGSSGWPVMPGQETSSSSVTRPSGNSTFAYEECMLPDQLMIYLYYGVLLALCISCILIQRYKWISNSGRRHLLEQRSVLVRWRDTSPHASTTATSLCSKLQFQEQQEQQQSKADERLYDDLINPLMKAAEQEPDIFESTMSKRQQRKLVWPLRSRLYWKMACWDLWNIARFAVPLYALLFIISFI